MTFRSLQGADLKGKTALVRVDFGEREWQTAQMQ